MNMKRILVLIAALAAGLPAAAAFAHAFLDHAVPAVGAAVPAAPKQVQLFFTQELEPAFSGATLAAADGRAIATAAATVDPQNKMAMVLNLPTLAPGHYKVSWHVVSVDTHRTEGSFSFDIQP
jgi:methionine-rich copper-binding protein CopC